MKILFVSEYFRPEPNAAATRVHENAWRWVAKGHEVTVVTTVPNFPQGRIHEGYQNHWYQAEVIDGVRAVRVKSFIHPNRGRLLRILDQFSFLPTGLLGVLREPRPDIVVVMSPTLFSALAAWFGAWLRRLPFVLEIGDLVAGSIDAVGAMRKGMLLRVVEWLERFVYRRADALIVQTPRMKRVVLAGGVTEERVYEISNGVNMSTFGKRHHEKPSRNGFVVGYIGTMGMAHGLHHMLDAAQLLQSDENIRFRFVGDGAQRSALEESAAARRLDNVAFEGPFPHADMPAAWLSLDLAIVSLRDHPTFETVVPSKIFEAMASGIPILLAAPVGEASDLVTRHGIGTVIAPEDPKLMAETIRQLCGSPELLQRQSQAALEFAHLYDREHQAERYAQILQRVAAERKKA